MTLKSRLTTEKALGNWLVAFVVVVTVALGLAAYAVISGYFRGKDADRVEQLQTDLEQAQADLERLLGLERRNGVLQAITAEPGATGSRGLAGLRGPAGPPGPPGRQGKRGTQGSSAARGQTGATGRVGARGQRGTVGPQGERGPPGPPGVSPTVEQVVAQTVAAVCQRLPPGICR